MILYSFFSVEAPAGGCELMTSTFKSPAPWIVQHRDFVQYRRVTMRQDQNGDPIYMVIYIFCHVFCIYYSKFTCFVAMKRNSIIKML